MSAVPIDNENKRLAKILARVDDLAVLPHVVFKVLELTGSSDSPAQEMERAIIVDPGFSSKVLTLANSAAYALPKKVTSIKDAIMFLGFRAVRSMAMTVGVFDMFVGKNDEESLRRRAWWRHSVDTAVCCKWLSQKTRKLSPEDAYTCGLLHYVGKTLLDRVGEEDYKQVSMLMESGKPDYEAEFEVYGCDHVSVVLGATSKWGFPDELVYGLDYIDEPNENDQYKEMRACTALASKISSLVMSGAHIDESNEEEMVLPKWAMNLMGIPVEETLATIEGGSNAISTAQHQS